MYKFWNIQMPWEGVMGCPKCGKQADCKDGRVNGRQRYLCKDCSHRYTVAQRSSAGDGAVKRQALELYLEGLGFRPIGRMLGFNNVMILNWTRAFGEQLGHQERQPCAGGRDRRDARLRRLKKNYCWIWVAVDRHGKRFLGCVLGTRGVATGERPWQALAPIAGEVMTDYWQPCEGFVPAGQHTQPKAETSTVGGYNSLSRHFLARLRRKSKCYSKCQKMLGYSVRLQMAKKNEIIYYS